MPPPFSLHQPLRYSADSFPPTPTPSVAPREASDSRNTTIPPGSHVILARKQYFVQVSCQALHPNHPSPGRSSLSLASQILRSPACGRRQKKPNMYQPGWGQSNPPQTRSRLGYAQPILPKKRLHALAKISRIALPTRTPFSLGRRNNRTPQSARSGGKELSFQIPHTYFRNHYAR